MATLIIRRDGKPTKEFVLEKGFTLIGRKADADIKIEDAEAVEERACILQVGEDFVLDTLGPPDGTLVNGQTAKKRVLKDRDLIVIGEYRLTFQDKREDEAPHGIEMEVAETRHVADLAKFSGQSVDPFRADSGGKSHLVMYLVLGAIFVGICFASYQSYVARQAADAQAALARKTYQESQQKEAEKIRDNARAVGSSMKGAEAPGEAPVAGSRP